jgi:hypothetical protein
MRKVRRHLDTITIHIVENEPLCLSDATYPQGLRYLKQNIKEHWSHDITVKKISQQLANDFSEMCDALGRKDGIEAILLLAQLMRFLGEKHDIRFLPGVDIEEESEEENNESNGSD